MKENNFVYKVWARNGMYFYTKGKANQLCPTLWNPTDVGLPGSSVHGILPARKLKWIAASFSSGSSWPRNQTQVSCTAGGFFTNGATREAQKYWSG